MQSWTLRPKAVIPLTTTSTSRAHVAHAPLRRLSEAALSACGDDELLALFAAEARGALPADAVDIVDGAAPDAPAVAHVAATARTHALDHPRVAAELGPALAARIECASVLLVPLAWAGDVRHVAVLGRRDAALARAAHALNVSLELQAVLDTLAREAGLAVGGGVSGVYLVDDDGAALATAGHNVPDEW